MQANHAQVKLWSQYFLIVLLTIFIHELGHCVIDWSLGIHAIPTPAKTYALNSYPAYLEHKSTVGGIMATLIIAVAGLIIYYRNPSRFNTVLLAGTIAMPVVYSLLFTLKGRGHGDTEFQYAQEMLGFSFSGHALDWIFIALIICAFSLWILPSKPKLKAIIPVMIGIVLTFIFVVVLQELNNFIFDPLFE